MSSRSSHENREHQEQGGSESEKGGSLNHQGLSADKNGHPGAVLEVVREVASRALLVLPHVASRLGVLQDLAGTRDVAAASRNSVEGVLASLIRVGVVAVVALAAASILEIPASEAGGASLVGLGAGQSGASLAASHSARLAPDGGAAGRGVVVSSIGASGTSGRSEVLVALGRVTSIDLIT